MALIPALKETLNYMAAGDQPRLSGPPSLHVLFMAAMTLFWSLIAVALGLIVLENIKPATIAEGLILMPNALPPGSESWGKTATAYATELLANRNLLPFLLAAGFCSLLALHCATAALGIGYYTNKRAKEKDKIPPEQAKAQPSRNQPASLSG